MSYVHTTMSSKTTESNHVNYKILLKPKYLAKRFRKKFFHEDKKALSLLKARGDVACPALTVEKLDNGSVWDDMMGAISEEVNENPFAFLRSPVTSRALHPDQQGLAKAYFKELCEDAFFVENILPKVSDPPMGGAYRFEDFPYVSPVTVQHLFYLNLIRKKLGCFIPDKKDFRVTEIGGGYGNMCRILKQLSYEGAYRIIDLPSMLSVQQHYLHYSLTKKQIETVDFLPLCEKNLSTYSQGQQVLFGTFSINEMPLDTRSIIEPAYKNFDYLFLSYNNFFDGIDNIEYFEKLIKDLSEDFDFNHFADPYRPSWFLLGKNKKT